MSGKFFDIGNNPGFSLSGGRSAHSLAECDLETAEASLIGTDAEKLSGYDDTVETRPQMSERVMNQSRDRGHRCNVVVDAIEDGIAMSFKLCIGAGFRRLSQVGYCLCHYQLIALSRAPAGKLQIVWWRRAFLRVSRAEASPHPTKRVREYACRLREGC